MSVPSLAGRVRAQLGRALRSGLDCGFYVNDGTLRTEIILPNPAVDLLAERLGGKLTVLTFYEPGGGRVRRCAVTVRRGRTRVVDTSRMRGLARFGQVRIRYFFAAGQARGGNRSIFHWYYPGGMTLVHEKKEPAPARHAPRGASLRPGQGYMTLFGVPADGPLDLYLVATSQDRIDAEIRLVRFDPSGGRRQSPPIHVPPRGAAFVGVRAWLETCPEILAGPIAIDAAPYALSYYYFLHNRQDGTWQAQHL